MTQRKHADLIKAWADGEEIEFLMSTTIEWVEVEHPTWNEGMQYRIKPKPAPWYENIPLQGVLCWVTDDVDESREETKEEGCIDIIIGLRKDTEHYRSKLGLLWGLAYPLTNDEIKEFLQPDEE